MKLRIGHLSTFYHTSTLLMASGDLEKRFGIEAEWRLFGTGPAIVGSFSRGETDIAYIGLPPVIIGIDKGMRIKCIAGGHVEGTVFAGKGNWKGFPEIQNIEEILKQFRNLKIGAPGTGSIHDVILKEYLDRFNLDKEIEVINFKWADLALEAIVKDEISAAFGTPALGAAIMHYANGRVLYPPSMIWPNNPSYGIIVNIDFTEANRGLVENFLVLHEETTAFIRTHTKEAAKKIADNVGFIDEAFVMDTLRMSPKYCSQITDSYVSSTMGLMKALKKLGYISRDILQDEVFDLSLIRKIHPKGDHYGEEISGQLIHG